MGATPIGTKAFYDAAGGTSYTQFPNKLISIQTTAGKTEQVPGGHLGARFRPTSPGGQEGGEITFQFECNTRVDADWDMYQLALGWYQAPTEGITFKTEFPKATGDTTGPTRIYHGYISEEPVIPSPETGRMTFDIKFMQTDMASTADGA